MFLQVIDSCYDFIMNYAQIDDISYVSSPG